MNTAHVQLHLDQMRLQAESLDGKRGQSRRPLFDEQLFSGSRKQIGPCVMQAAQSLSRVEQMLSLPDTEPAKLGYLCDHLAQQIHALQREIATALVSTQIDTPPSTRHDNSTKLNGLYQALHQHKEWEGRLEAMLANTLSTAGQSTTLATKEQQAIQGRLRRCRIAREKIELQIHYYERNKEDL